MLSLMEYLDFPKEYSLAQTIKKLTEATTDALFNLPAILTVQLWSDTAPAYLYSFEHLGSSKIPGSSFLKGLPIVASSQSQFIAHGDDLAYLFDAHNIHGEPLQNGKLTNETDKKVREIFSSLISEFAYLSSGQNIIKRKILKKFDRSQSNFIRIDEDVAQAKDFRFCQLSLWGVLVEQSDKNTSCAFILNQWTTSLLEKTGNITNALEGMLENSLHGLNLNVDQPIKTSNRNNKILKV